MSKKVNKVVRVNRVSDMPGLDQEDIAEAYRLVPEDRHVKVRFCADLIMQAKLVPGKTYRDLALIWNIERSTARAYTSEAYRLFKSKIDPEQLQNALLEKLEYVVSSSMRAKKPFLTREGQVVYADQPDHKAAINGILGIGELAGLKVRRHEHKVSHEESHTKEELEALIKQGLSEVKARIIETRGVDANEQFNKPKTYLPERIPSANAGASTGDLDEPERVRSGGAGSGEDNREAER